MNNINNDSMKKDLNAYLSVEEGAKDAAKILPLLIPAALGQIEDSISQMAQHSLVMTQSIEDNFNQTNNHAQEIQSIKQSLEAIQAALGISGVKTNQQESIAQVQPREPMQAPSELGDLSSLLNQFKSAGQNQKNQ